MNITSIIDGLVPDVIISQQEFEKITGIHAYTQVNVNTVEGLSREKEQTLLDTILNITKNDHSVTTWSITDEKENA